MNQLPAITITLFGLAVAASPAAETTAPTTQPARPVVEVVFVLDTTGSMGGLINAAKEKIWAIANTLATSKPVPDIRMGLVGYRDRGDDYITKRTDLTGDLDAVYKALMTFEASGGGDGPESVNEALHEAITAISWSKAKDTYRVVFLFGDCPPHMDYDNDVKYPETCERAARAGILINTIQCGHYADTTPVWEAIAKGAEGRYFRVEQSGGAILAATPFDAELAKLSTEFDDTRLTYGSQAARTRGERRKADADAISKAATLGARARRAEFYAGAAGEAAFADKAAPDLATDVSSGTIALDAVAEDELPEPMRAMSAEQREQYVKETAAKREALQSRIRELAEKRQAHLQEAMRNAGKTGARSLDAAIFECIKTQAAKKGLTVNDGPSL